MPGFTEEQNEALSAIRIIASTISMLGSGFIIAMYLAYRDLRKFAFKLVVMLSICDVILGIGNYMGDGNQDNSTCHVQGFVIQFGSISGVFWTAVIAYCIWEVVLHRTNNLNIEDKMNTFHIAVWGSSFVLSIVPFFSNSYGDADGWCWISKYGKHSEVWGTTWRMICFYIPLWITIVLIIVIYRRTLRVLDRSAETFKRMRWYPMVLVATYFFATIDRVWQLFGDANYELCVFRVFFVSLAGFFNVLIYGWTPTVKDKLRTCLHNKGFMNYDKLDSRDSDPYMGSNTKPLLVISDAYGDSTENQEDIFIPPRRNSGDVFVNPSDSSNNTTSADGI